MSGPLVPSFVVIAVASWLALRDRERIARSRRRFAGWLVALSVLASLLVAYEVLVPRAPIVTASLQPADPPLSVDDPHRLALLVRGELPEVEQGEAAGVRYAIIVRGASGEETTMSGHFEESWQRRRVGRKSTFETLSVHDEDRFELPRGPVDIRVAFEEGSRTGPLRLSVVPAPLPGWLVDLAALGLTLGAVALDVLEEGRTSLGIGVGTLTVFSALMAVGITPGAAASRVLTAAIAALTVGGGGATLAQFLLRKLLRR